MHSFKAKSDYEIKSETEDLAFCSVHDAGSSH